MQTSFGFLMGTAAQAAGNDKKKQEFVFGLMTYLSIVMTMVEQCSTLEFLKRQVKAVRDGKETEPLRIMAIARNFGERYGTSVLDLGWVNASPKPEEYTEEANWLLDLIEQQYAAMDPDELISSQRINDVLSRTMRR